MQVCTYGNYFLGHVINSTDISIDSKKNEAIIKYPRPTNKRQLQRWIGLRN